VRSRSGIHAAAGTAPADTVSCRATALLPRCRLAQSGSARRLAGECFHHLGAQRLDDSYGAAEYFGVEAPRALDIVRDDEVGQHNPLWGGASSAMWHLHWLGLVPRLRRGLQPRL